MRVENCSCRQLRDSDPAAFVTASTVCGDQRDESGAVELHLRNCLSCGTTLAIPARTLIVHCALGVEWIVTVFDGLLVVDGQRFGSEIAAETWTRRNYPLAARIPYEELKP